MTTEGLTKSEILEQINEERPLMAATKPVKSAKLGQYIAALSGNSVKTYISAFLFWILACLGTLAAGAVTGWTGNISEDMKEFTYNGITIDDGILEWIGSLPFLASAISCITVTMLCDVIGRKMTMLLLTLPYVVGWMFIIFANKLWMLYTGRVLTGFASGALLIVAPIYICEIADKDVRGALASYSDWLMTIGITLAYVLGSYLDMHAYTVIMGMLPVIFACVFSFQPESPTYLMRKMEYTKAKCSLIRLRGKFYDVEKELEEIKLSIIREKQNSTTFLNSIKQKSSQRAVFICFVLMIFEQAGGIYVILTYLETIFEMTGVPIDDQILTIIIGVLQVIATFFSTITVDHIGRRVLLISSNLGTMVSMAFLAVFFTLHDRNLVDNNILSDFGLVPIISLSIYVVAFSFGMGPLPWVLIGELFPAEIKSFGGGCAATINFFLSFLITNFYFDVEHAIGSDICFYCFSIMCLMAAIFVYYFVPETRNKSLDEIQCELSTC